MRIKVLIHFQFLMSLIEISKKGKIKVASSYSYIPQKADENVSGFSEYKDVFPPHTTRLIWLTTTLTIFK